MLRLCGHSRTCRGWAVAGPLLVRFHFCVRSLASSRRNVAELRLYEEFPWDVSGLESRSPRPVAKKGDKGGAPGFSGVLQLAFGLFAVAVVVDVAYALQRNRVLRNGVARLRLGLGGRLWDLAGVACVGTANGTDHRWIGSALAANLFSGLGGNHETSVTVTLPNAGSATCCRCPGRAGRRSST